MAGGMPAFKVHVSGADGQSDAAQSLSNKEASSAPPESAVPSLSVCQSLVFRPSGLGFCRGAFPTSPRKSSNSGTHAIRRDVLNS